MNERIKQLWDKANLQWKDEFEQASEPRECRTARDIFAELIVRDCMKTAQSVSELRGVTEEHIYGADTACLLISKRYGVDL